MAAMRDMMSRLKLTVNETKTRRCKVPEETFDFLGYTIGLCRSQAGKSFIGTRPSAKKVKRLCREISEQTSRRWGLLDGRGVGGSPEQETGRVGELLLAGAGQQGLSRRGQPRAASAPPLAVSEAPGGGSRDVTVSRRIPPPNSGPEPPGGSKTQLRVSDSMSPCPRAGCGKSACPVR